VAGDRAGETADSGMKNSYLGQAWLVLILAVCFGGALAGVQITLGPRIERNKENQARRNIPQLVFGQGQVPADFDPDKDLDKEILTVRSDGREVPYTVYKVTAAGRLAGWAVKASGQGFADRIEVLIGLNAAAERITGLFVLDQKETPGLGNNITHAVWRDQFAGLNAARPVRVVKGAEAPKPNAIHAVTGATISSRAVVDIVNTALRDVRARLAR